MASKHGKLYEKSPKLERNEDGDMEVKKADEPKAEGKEKTVSEDGSSAEDGGEVKNKKHPHQMEMEAMHKRHEEEQSAMHERHKSDFKEMHKRHAMSSEAEGEKTSGELINKVESDSKE